MAPTPQSPGITGVDPPREDDLRTICEVSPCSILVTDASGRINYVNPAFEHLNGFARAEVVGKKPGILKSGSHPPEFYEELWKTISSGNTWTGRLQNRRKDGSLYWSDMTITPGRDKEGKIVSYVAVGHNVAQVMVAGDAAAQFFEQPMTLNLISTADGVIRLVNQAWQRFLGYQPDDLEGKSFMDLIHPEDREATLQQMDKLAHGTGVLDFENRYRCKNGDYRTLTWAARSSSENGFIYAVAIDTTERKRAEDALRVLNERHNELIRRIPVGIYTIHATAGGQIRFDYVSERMCRMFDVDERDCLRDPECLFGKVHPDDRANLDDTNRRGAATGKPLHWDGRCIVAGETLWLHIESDPTMLPNGDSLWNGVVIDVTEHKRIEENLKAGEARFRAFFELPLNGRCITSVEKGWIAVNDRLCEMLGYTREELIGKTWSEMTHPEDLAADLAQFNRMLSGESDQYRLQKRFIRKDGSVIWAEIIVGCIRKRGGAVDYIVCVIDDVTERKRVERELSLTAHRLKLATKAGGVGIWDYDIGKNVLTWDDQMFALYGTARDAFEGAYAAWRAGLHPDDRERGDQEIKLALDGVKNFDTEFRVLRPDGVVRHIRALAIVQRSADGKPLRMIGTNWDITDRKVLEADLETALEQAKEAARTKSDFLAVMSHELRTPLNGVLGFSELLTCTPLDEEQKVYADTVRESGEHLLSIVNDILDFSSFDRGAVSLRRVPFALAQVVDSSGAAIRKAAVAKGLAFHCEIASDAPMEVTGDERRIGQILDNLLANAVKFTARGSVVLRVSPAAENGRPFLHFTVEDTGIGISANTLAGLFRAFTQADPSSKRSFGGIGLGLAISQRLADAMGGSISVESTPGKGSAFTFHLPLETPTPPVMPTTSQSSAPQPADGKHVLLVEDDDSNSRLAGKMLEILGCHVDFAPHGAAAVESFAPGKYAAIFMDVRMPVMDGIEATARIRAMEAPTGSRVPIIALTANAMPGDREFCLASGMDDFISKPFKKEELAAKLAGISAKAQ